MEREIEESVKKGVCVRFDENVKFAWQKQVVKTNEVKDKYLCNVSLYDKTAHTH